MSDFNMVCSRTIEDLKIEEANKRREAMRVGPSHVSEEDLRKIQNETRVDMIQAEKKMLQRKLAT